MIKYLFLWACILWGPLSLAAPQIVGNWSSDCYPLPKRHSIIFQAKFSKAGVSAKAFQFADNACQIFNLTVSIQGDYIRGKKWGEGFEINFAPKSLGIEIFNPEALGYFNKSKACGFSDWALNEKKELINQTCDSRVVPNLKNNGLDIYNVLDGKLLFGGFPFDMAQNRPNKLSHILPLKKMNGDIAEIVSFRNRSLALHGLLYKPKGKGPFPAVLYNHGSAKGMLNNQASEILGPLYVKHGWAFFMPYRRGQGLSLSAGPYIVDQINKAAEQGAEAGEKEMVRLLTTDHFEDQMAALVWLKSQDFVEVNRIAVAGNSFGGVETLLGTQHEVFCAAIDASGGAESWADAPQLRNIMTKAILKSDTPTFFFQARNDFDISPSLELYKVMKDVGKNTQIKIYSPYGNSPEEGHSFAYMGSRIWQKDVFNFLKHFCN